MTQVTLIDLANRYFVGDRSEALLPATRLSNILDALLLGRPLTAIALSYLQKQGFESLQRLAEGEIDYAKFCEIAPSEKIKREAAAEVERLAKNAAKIAGELAWNAQYELECKKRETERIARQSDPKYINKVKNQKLRAYYGIDGFIEPHFFPRLMAVLRQVDGGNRFLDEDVLWLTTEGKDYYSGALKTVFHEREAKFHADEYKRTNDPWMAVNASSHFRKCDKAKIADELLTSIPVELQGSLKLRSALYTTHGGVKRDIGRLNDALKFGEQAHALTPKDFRPCTLMGAVNIELGNYDIGKAWYEKAVERGASKQSIDQDIRSIFYRADKVKRSEIKAFLLNEDSQRYSWVKTA